MGWLTQLCDGCSDANSDVGSPDAAAGGEDADRIEAVPEEQERRGRKRLRSQSRQQSSEQDTDFSDIPFPALDVLYGPHLRFHPEEDGQSMVSH